MTPHDKAQAIRELLSQMDAKLERCKQELEESKLEAARRRQARVEEAERESPNERAAGFAERAFRAMEDVVVERAEETAKECRAETARYFFQRWMEIEDTEES